MFLCYVCDVRDKLKADGYTLVATYAGNTDYAGSTSAKNALTVLK